MSRRRARVEGVVSPGDAPKRLPPQATMGLLGYLTAHALDEDYAFVSAQNTPHSEPKSQRRIGLWDVIASAQRRGSLPHGVHDQCWR